MNFSSQTEASLFEMASREIRSVLIQRAQDEAKARNEIRNDMKTGLQQAAKDRDIDTILALERVLLLAELHFLGESRGRINSLDAGIIDLEVSITMVGRVRDHDYYQRVNEDLRAKKHRKGELPNDAGRQAFRSHIARLKNFGIGRLEDSERELLNTRTKNIRVAESIYKELQEQALGIGPGVAEPQVPYLRVV